VSTASSPRVEAVIDLGAVRANIARLRDVAQGSQLMVVVKADGYGHGMQPVARAAREGGADWLGVAVLEEALALRGAGDTGRLLCWLARPGESYDAAVRADIDLTASSLGQLGRGGRRRAVRGRPRETPAQGGHRAVPQRLPAVRLAGPGERRGRRAAQRRGHGDRRVVTPGVRRRA
jgi:alanine racemase